MKDFIILLGEVPPSDKEVVQSTAQIYDLDYRILENVRDFSGSLPLPKGFLSFLPSDRQILLECFSKLPVGAGSEIPFFQRVENGARAQMLRELVQARFECEWVDDGGPMSLVLGAHTGPSMIGVAYAPARLFEDIPE